MEAYKPISCLFHDVLLHHATLKDEVVLVYYDNSIQQTVRTRIMDVITRGGEEFMLTSSGDSIRLDYIVSINDQILSHYC